MDKKIIFSTGNFHVKGTTINKCISLCKDLDVDGIEVCILNLSELADISKRSLNEHNTIHAPIREARGYGVFVPFYYAKCTMTKLALNIVYKLADEINAQNINFHDLSRTKGGLFKYKYNHTIENLLKRPEIKSKPYVRQLEKHKKFNFLLDVCHARNEVEEYIKVLGDKTKYIHLSTLGERTDAGNQTHQPLCTRDADVLKKISPVKSLDAHVIIETHIRRVDVDLMKREIDFVKEWLYQ